MFKLIRAVSEIVLFSLALVVASHCGAKKPSGETTKTTAKERSAKPKRSAHAKSGKDDAQVFAALPKATTMADLPFLIGPDGLLNIPCFAIIDKLQPEDVNFELRNLISENSKAVDDAIRAWFVEDLAPSGLTQEIASSWEIKVENAVVLNVSKEDVRFIEGQQCIDSARGWLQEDARAVTTLIGARKLSFTSTTPIDNYLQEEMIRAVGAQNMVLESPTLFVYEPVVDGMGNPVINQQGEPLFKSPSGTFITEKEIPPLDQRLMKQWTISSDAPLYFAYRELPNDAWRKEFRKQQCDVYLVWGDTTPRAPDCAEFNASGFSAKEKGDGEIEVTITTDGNAMSTSLNYGDVRMIPVSDKIILWLGPKKIEEGVLLRVNSLVLDPKPMSSAARYTRDKSDVPMRETRREVRRETKREMKREEAKPEEPKREVKHEEEEREKVVDEEKPAPPKKEKERAKPKEDQGDKTDEQSIDDFLNQ